MQPERIRHQNVPEQRIPQRREDPLPFQIPVRKKRNPVSRPSLHNLFKHTRQFEQNLSFHGGSRHRKKGWQLVAWSWLGSLIDGLILIAITSLFVLAFSAVIHTPLHTIGPLFVEIFLLCTWIYMISFRTFMGASIGEWACDLRLGQPHERISSLYALRVALRASLIMVSGFILLPLLSFIFRRDIAGAMTGLKIFSLK